MKWPDKCVKGNDIFCGKANWSSPEIICKKAFHIGQSSTDLKIWVENSVSTIQQVFWGAKKNCIAVSHV